ncbi:MAG: hypothetical protein GOV01_00410 [Candidatus Altiarchaeota archaeon]|nr:hypothetical protein [Candidatus Altiarchaeota archaeon]
MHIRGLSKSLNSEAESNVELLSKLFELQRLKSMEQISSEVFAAPNGTSTFLLTRFEGEMALFDIIPTKGDIQMTMLKGNSIKKLIEIKKGKMVLLENSLAGSALPVRP